jgi:hypothetical protein
MDCRACGGANDERRRFCGECGGPLAAVCPGCGVPDEDGSRFCGHCGAALAVTREPDRTQPKPEIGSPYSIAFGLQGLASVLAHGGDVASLELAEACIVAGDPERACVLADEALAVVERRGTWMLGPRAALVQARASRAAGGLRNAKTIRAALERCEELSRKVGARNYLPLATLERAALAELEGDRDARVALLRDALSGFERMNARFRAAQVRGLLDDVG